jgi:hypothetical protein
MSQTWEAIVEVIEDSLCDLPRPPMGWTWEANEVLLALVEEGVLAPPRMANGPLAVPTEETP